MGKIPAIVSAINSWLHKHPGIENSLPQYAFWSDSSSAAHTISVMCYTSKARGNMPAEHALRQEFLGHIDKVLSDHG